MQDVKLWRHLQRKYKLVLLIPGILPDGTSLHFSKNVHWHGRHQIGVNSRVTARNNSVLGSQNTIIASGDSRIDANLVPAVPMNIFAEMEARTVWEYAGYEQHQLLLALEMSPEFDVVHSHIGWGAYLLSSIPGVRERMLHTQHNPVTHDLEWFVSRHPDMRFSTVSEFQARKLRQQGVKRCQVIQNAIDVEAFTFQERGGEELLFIGRIEKDKGPDVPIRVAQNLGCPLVLARPAVDHEFFDTNIKPFLDDQIRYLGPVVHHQKNGLF